MITRSFRPETRRNGTLELMAGTFGNYIMGGMGTFEAFSPGRESNKCGSAGFYKHLARNVVN